MTATYTGRDQASSVQGMMMRITRLNDDGTINAGFPVLTTKGFITASFSPEIEEGDEITEKAADGTVCISWKGNDSLKRLNFNLSVCTPDPETTALLAGGAVIRKSDYPGGGGDVIGYTSPAVGDVVGNPVAIELWSIANRGGKPAAGAPYWWWVFPYVKLRYEGDREFGNAALANEYTGQALGNAALATGTAAPVGSFQPTNPQQGTPTLPDGTDGWNTAYNPAFINPFSYVRSDYYPPEGWMDTLSKLLNGKWPVATALITTKIPGAADTFRGGPPEDLAALNKLTRFQLTGQPAWTDHYVELKSVGSGVFAHWDGSTWVGGKPTGIATPTYTSGADVPPTAAADNGSVYFSTGAGKNVYLRKGGAWVRTGVSMVKDAAGTVTPEMGKALDITAPVVASTSKVDDTVVVQTDGTSYRIAQYSTAASRWGWVGTKFAAT